jgi:transcriptional regulator with GAF, ATPase, and Fis domain
MSAQFAVLSRVPFLLRTPQVQEQLMPGPRSRADDVDDLEHLAARLVGKHAVDRAQHRLKRAMLVEALSRTGGNYSRAARLLGVTRQAVQQMVGRYELQSFAEAARAPGKPGGAACAG